MPSVNFTFNVVSQIDPNDDDIENIEISLEGVNESFMTWNDQEKQIELSNIGVEQIGTHKVIITISDKFGASTTAEFVFEI